MDTFTLSHTELHRRGSSSNGITVAERYSADFLVNGQSLLGTIVSSHGGHADFMGCFVKGYPDQNKAAAAVLLLEAPPDSKSGRVLLYICPECGDLGCGAYAARVSKSSAGYVWDSFAYENGYEEPHLVEGVGSFFFEREAYEKAIRSASAL